MGGPSAEGANSLPNRRDESVTHESWTHPSRAHRSRVGFWPRGTPPWSSYRPVPCAIWARSSPRAALFTFDVLVWVRMRRCSPRPWRPGHGARWLRRAGALRVWSYVRGRARGTRGGGPSVPVTWWSGGGPSVPLVARLARPTHSGGWPEVAATLVLLPAAAAMGRRLPVMVFPVASRPRRCPRSESDGAPGGEVSAQ